MGADGMENRSPSNSPYSSFEGLRGKLWLTFPTAVETQFEAACGTSRSRNQRLKILCSLVVFDLFILADWPILGHGIWLSALIRFGVVTPAILAGETLVTWSNRGVVCETTRCFLSTLIALSPLAIYHGTPLLVAVGHTALIVISIVGMTLVRLRTPYAFGQGVVLIVSDLVYAQFNPSMRLAERVLFVLLVSAAVVFNFLFNRLLELEERMAFLSTLSDEVKSGELKLQATALSAAANAIVITDISGAIAWTNPAFSALTGYTAEEVRGKNPRLLKSDYHDDAFYAQMWATITAGEVWHGEMLNRRKDQSFYSEEMTITPVSLRQNELTHFIAIKQDITKRKLTEHALHKAEEKYRAIFEDAVVGMFQATLEGCPRSVNGAFAQLHGYDSPAQFLAEVSDIPHQLFVVPSRMDELRRTLIENGIVRGAEFEICRRDGAKRWVLANLRVIRVRGLEVNPLLYEGTVEDITDRKLAEAQVQFLAYHDGLTGLPNRILLDDRLHKALARARRQKDRVAILYLDLDRFKLINDSLGRAAGDILLQQVADRLTNRAREQETVARVGGDEFVIILSDVKDIESAIAGTERILWAMREVFLAQNQSLTINCSLGISIFPDHATDSETLIKYADAAMSEVKDLGRNDYRLFSDEMSAQASERLTLERLLRLALGENQLFLMYQPQMAIATKTITGLEALVRWNHPELGVVMPASFIEVAENCGLILSIGTWVLRTVCAQARKWLDEGVLAGPVAVNVSAIQLRQGNFSDLLRAILLETGLDPHYLELELTESLLLTNVDTVISVLKELKGMGVKLAVDDFGTGYSSLSYLRQFRIDKLKIDQSFIRNIAENSDDAVIANAIIQLAHGLHLKVIAEGVETEAQVSILRAHECDDLQGYFFSKPLSVDDATDLLKSSRL